MNMKSDNARDWTTGWQSSIAVKITGAVLYVLVAIGFAVALFLLRDTEGNLRRKYVHEAELIAFEARHALMSHPNVSLGHIADHFRSHIQERGFHAIVLSGEGQKLVIGGIREGDEQLEQTVVLPGKGRPGETTTIGLTLYHGSVHGAAVAARNEVFLITGGVAILFGFFLTWVILRFITPPMQRLLEATKAVAAGDLTVRLPVDRSDEFGGLSAFFNQMLDKIQQELKEREQAEEALRLSHQFIRTTIDSMKDGIAVVDADSFRILSVNAAFLAEYGISSDEAIGKTCYEVTHHRKEKCLPPDDLCPFFETLETGSHASAEHFHFGRDGQKTVVEVTVSPIKDEGGDIVQFVHISRDVTRRNQDEEKLRQYAQELQEANGEIRNFTYIVSHDLRAPLVSIKGFSGELGGTLRELGGIVDECLPHLSEERRRELDLLKADLWEALGFIGSSVSRMDGLINGVLSLSRLGHREMKLEPVDTGEVARKVLESLAHQIEKNSVAVTMKNLPTITADRFFMEQIMGNLLDNALKYLDQERTGELSLWTEDASSETVFHIRDNGRGIAEKDQARIFDIFQRAGKQEEPGEGMGLTYVKTLVKRHGGRIWCSSQPGNGSTFSFSISKTIEPLRENP